MRWRRRPRPRPAPAAVRAERQAARRVADRTGPHRGAGRRHPRPQRQSLCRLAPWRHHALLGAGLSRRWRSLPISAASRSAWRSTARTISMSASAAWASIASRPSARSRRSTDETNRSLYSVNDDSRLRLADDLDIADDGRIFFSEATMRYEMHEWPVDGLEARGNGRIICYDPNTNTTRTVLRGLKFPNGICIASDGQSILFAETLGCCDQALLVRRPEERPDRDGDRQSAGLSRQHQSRLRRQLLAGDGRHAQPRARSGLEDAGLSPADGQAGADRRMAVPQHQHRLRHQVQREGRGARIRSGT